MSNTPLCSAVVLVKNRNNIVPEIESIFPETFKLGNDKCTFNSSVKNNHKAPESFISFFNTENFYCTSLNFEYQKIEYSIVTLSKYPFYDFYRFMFDAVKKAFDNGFVFRTPKDKFDCIVSAVSKLPENDYDELKIIPNSEDFSPDSIPASIKVIVSIANTSFIYNFTHNSFTFKKFQPSQYFTQEEYMGIWQSLLTNEPVLILSKDQIKGASAALASASLFSPLPFSDKMCIWLNPSDPRIDQMNAEGGKFLLCATHPDNLPKVKNNFKHIVELRQNIENPDISAELEILKMMKGTMFIMQKVLNDFSEENDPYYNMVEGQINDKYVFKELQKFKEYQLPSMDNIREFEKTQSFRKWRKNLAPDEDYRDTFLNLDPETLFKDKTKEELKIIEQNLRLVIKKYKKDAHVEAVLKHHRKVLRRMLSIC